jgi:drug/metabolite transporter (DMT)-like permease
MGGMGPVAGGVDPSGLLVTSAVLGAAVLHASWNAIAHAIRDKLVAFTLIATAYTCCAGIATPFVARPSPAAWPFLLASAALHVVYNLLLMQAYRLGDFNQAYPLARGTSPWVVAVVAALVVGERLRPGQVLAIAIISAGLASLVFAGGLPGRRQLPALAAALVSGLAIASYTVVDGLGVRLSDTVPGYASWLFLLQGPMILVLALAWRRRELVRPLRAAAPAGLFGGLLSLVAYALVLWAQTVGQLATVAALRETSVVIGAALGTLVFREPFGRSRLVATGAVAGGIVLLNLAA